MVGDGQGESKELRSPFFTLGDAQAAGLELDKDQFKRRQNGRWK